MGFNIKFKESSLKELKKISKPDAKQIVFKVISDLSRDPLSYPELKGDFKGLRKFRVGDYRVIFTVVENDILVLRVGHRKDVYK